MLQIIRNLGYSHSRRASLFDYELSVYYAKCEIREKKHTTSSFTNIRELN